MDDPAGADGSRSMKAHKGTRGECAAARFRELLSRTDTVPPDELEKFGWTIPLITTCDPSPYCIPKEVFSFVPKEENIYKIFFKDTSVSNSYLLLRRSRARSVRVRA